MSINLWYNILLMLRENIRFIMAIVFGIVWSFGIMGDFYRVLEVDNDFEC